MNNKKQFINIFDDGCKIDRIRKSKNTFTKNAHNSLIFEILNDIKERWAMIFNTELKNENTCKFKIRFEFFGEKGGGDKYFGFFVLTLCQFFRRLND